MSLPLNSSLLKKFLEVAGERLTGDWLLVGGSLLPAVGLDVRSTVDIDFLSLGPEVQQLELMEVADSISLSVDTVNQAALFFLKKVGYSPTDLISLHKGSKAKIFRPSVELYWRLKAERMSETDFQDCLHYLEFCRNVQDPIQAVRLREAMAKKDETSAEKKARRHKLSQSV